MTEVISTQIYDITSSIVTSYGASPRFTRPSLHELGLVTRVTSSCLTSKEFEIVIFYYCYILRNKSLKRKSGCINLYMLQAKQYPSNNTLV